MKIYIASYQTLMLNKGGPTYKALIMKEELIKNNIDAVLFDMWNTSLEIKDIDLFHIFKADIHTYSLAVNLKLRGVKYVVNPIFFSNYSAKTLKFYNFLEKPFRKIFKNSYSNYSLTEYICSNAEKVLPNTKAEAELLIKGLNINRNKIHIIHNGVEKRFADADPSIFEKKYNLKDFILYVGHLGAVRKNGPNIIKALNKIEHPAVLIADILHNKEGEYCRKEINRSKNVIHIDWIKHDNPLLSSAYAACKTFILPTRYETPGRAALEAGLAGANIVITPYGGTKEYFADMADYAEPHSIESIKKTIEKSLNKKKSKKLREYILNNYTWEKVARDTALVYKEILTK